MKSEKNKTALYRLVITHYLIAGICFAALSIMLLFSVDSFGGHYFNPKLLALTHTAALGWGTVIIFGSCYQLLPIILETGLYSIKLAWLSISLFVPGLFLLVCAFWQFDVGLCMQAGSVLLLSGIACFVLNACLTSAGNKTLNSIYREFITTASIWLLATTTLGALLVFNFQYAFLPKDHLQFLRLHAHAGIAGWFLLLIIGVSSKLIPMFLVSKVQKVKLLSASYYLINLALIAFITDGYIYGINLKTYLFAGLAISGIVCYFVYVFWCFKSRMRKAIDLPITNTVISIVFLASAIVALPVVIRFSLTSNPLALKLSTLYGTLIFIGWISSLILGQTFKTMPFIVWAKQYEHLAGRAKTPMPADLFNNSLLKIQTFCFGIFCLAFYSGLLAGNTGLVYLGMVSLCFCAAFYLSNLLKVVFHKPKVLV